MWALGNGLATSTLITTLAGDYGARGVAVSVILAAPTVVGLGRQLAPWLMVVCGGRKRFCISMYLLSAGTLLVLPVVAAPGMLPRGMSLAGLVTLWCCYQVLEYFGTVGLWSWLGDLAPQPTRGSFLGTREAWMSVGRFGGMIASGLFTFYWPVWMSRETLWQAYSISSFVGAIVMMLAVWPLLDLPALELSSPAPHPSRTPWSDLLWAPLRNRSFRRLVAYGCWLGAVNGLLGASQFLFARRFLGLSLLLMLAMRAETEVGQTAISASVGRWIDRIGNKRVMIVSQLLVALAMLFYLVATPQQWWWIFGASTLFIAYAGLNVGIPNLLLKLSPREQRTTYVAAYYAWAGLAYGLASLGGGMLFDYAAAAKWSIRFDPMKLDHFAIFFASGLILRAAGAWWIAAVPEGEVEDKRAAA